MNHSLIHLGCAIKIAEQREVTSNISMISIAENAVPGLAAAGFRVKARKDHLLFSDPGICSCFRLHPSGSTNPNLNIFNCNLKILYTIQENRVNVYVNNG